MRGRYRTTSDERQVRDVYVDLITGIFGLLCTGSARDETKNSAPTVPHCHPASVLLRRTHMACRDPSLCVTITYCEGRCGARTLSSD